MFLAKWYAGTERHVALDKVVDRLSRLALGFCCAKRSMLLRVALLRADREMESPPDPARHWLRYRRGSLLLGSVLLHRLAPN